MSAENRPQIGDFPAGSRVAGYQIQELIGRGGMAVVYRAADVRLDRLVALKVLAPDLTRDSAFRQRFIRESRSGAAVDHPNVIPVFEAGEAEGVLFIAMRYVAGRDIRALIDREGPLRPARVVSIVTQIASALDTAHAHGLVHRDVKPANMLLGSIATGSAPDHVYLSDFGLSKMSVAAVSLTGTGQFLGTLDYMSPEQVEGRPIDGRTDQYALACAAFEMLTGRPPFQRDQDLAVMWAQVSAPPPSVREFRPGLPAEVDQVIAKALAKAPDSRHASCLAFATDLRTACMARPPGQAGPPGAPTELAATAKPAPPATELAFAAPSHGPEASGRPGGPEASGRPGGQGAGAAHPPVGTGQPRGAAGRPPTRPRSPRPPSEARRPPTAEPAAPADEHRARRRRTATAAVRTARPAVTARAAIRAATARVRTGLAAMGPPVTARAGRPISSGVALAISSRLTRAHRARSLGGAARRSRSFSASSSSSSWAEPPRSSCTCAATGTRTPGRPRR